MARVKATTTDIHARLARGECANYRSGNCQGKRPCSVTNGEACDYFAAYVLPLLEYPEFAGKYAREAKITVALNPQSKVVRKRRQEAAIPTLALEQAKSAKPAVTVPTPAHTAAAKVDISTASDRKAAVPARRAKAVTPTLTLDAGKQPPVPAPVSKVVASVPASKAVTPKAPVTERREQAITTVVSVEGEVSSKPRVDSPKRAILPEQPQLFLEISPAEAPKRKTARKR